jgi:hypothetical protein
MPLLGIYRSIHQSTFPDRQGSGSPSSSTGVEKLLATSFLERAVERVVEDVAQREQAHEVAALVDHHEAVHA